MSMSDCPNCWDTLCCCGYQYRDWKPKEIDDLRKVLLKVKKIQKEYPNLSDQEFCDELNER